MNDAARIAELEAEVQGLRAWRDSHVCATPPVLAWNSGACAAAPVPATMIVNAGTGQSWQNYSHAFANTGCAAPAPQIQTFGVHA